MNTAKILLHLPYKVNVGGQKNLQFLSSRPKGTNSR